MKSFVLLPILIALAQDREPFNSPRTPEQEYILQYYELNDPVTRRSTAQAMLAAAEKSLQRTVEIAIRRGTEHHEKRVVRSAMTDLYNEQSDGITIFPQINRSTKVMDRALDTEQAFMWFSDDSSEVIQQASNNTCIPTFGKRFCKLPLRNNEGYISFAQHRNPPRSTQQLLEAIAAYKNSRPTHHNTRTIGIALPLIRAHQETTGNSIHFDATFLGEQLYSNVPLCCTAQERVLGRFLKNPFSNDFLIPPSKSCLCWITDQSGIVTFATHCTPQDYATGSSRPYEQFDGSFEAIPE